MSHFLTADQQLIVNSVREFCQSQSIQKMAQEEKMAMEFPIRSWQAAAEQGYIASYLPEEYGGMGYDLTTHYAIFEELVRNGYPCCSAIAGHVLGILSIEHWGTEEQKRLFLPELGSGAKICCGAVTDPAGITNFDEWGLKEQETEGGWLLNGTKVLTTNAANADYKIVFGRPVNGGKWFDHVYVIPKDTPGLRAGDYWLGPSFMMVAIEGLVFGEHGFRMGLDFATQRSRGDKKIISFQKVAHNLADMAIRNEAGRGLIYTAARLWDEGRREECRRLASMAKAFVCEGANKNLHDATMIHGGIGCTIPAGVGVLWAASIQLEMAEMPCDMHRDFVIESYGVKLDWKN